MAAFGSQLFSLLNQTSGSAMATVFEICSGAVRREVDQLTLNAELRRTEDSGELSSFEIPQRLVEMLWKYSLAPPQSKAETARMLLSWLLMCNFFQDTVSTPRHEAAILRLKLGYRLLH